MQILAQVCGESSATLRRSDPVMNRVVIRSRLLNRCVVALVLTAFAEEFSLPASAREQPEAASPVPDEQAAKSVDELNAEKRRKAMAALMAVTGILIGGIAFLAIVIVWGARLRRLARRELQPQTTLQNDLWFLKPPKSNNHDEKSDGQEQPPSSQ
jgi:hypothetical protein